MNTKIKNENKLRYSTPTISRIKLDNEISLALESSPPAGPEETLLPRYLNNDPFKQLA